MKIRLALNFFLKEFLLFAGTMAVGLFIAYRHSDVLPAPDPIEPLEFSWPNILAMLVFFVLFSFVLTRYRRAADWSFRIFLMLVMFSGAELLLGTFVSFPYDTIYALATLGLILLVRNVLAHDIGIGLGVAGISAFLGLSLEPTTAVFLLVFLSAYDIIAVYKTKHMVSLARGMIQSGAIFGFIIPFHWRDFFEHKKHAEPGERFMILGSGDIGLPIVLAASVARESMAAAGIVAAFASLGLFATHLAFVNQSGRHPMAALPPIALMSILGFLIAIILLL